MIQFTWCLHNQCNYRCPYCWFHDKWDRMQEHNRYPGTERLVSLWRRIYDKYGKVELFVAGGGEPFTYPDFNSLVARLSEFHEIKIITNLSGDIDALANSIKHRKLMLIMSFHPLSIGLNEFLEKAGKAQQLGFEYFVNLVGYPPFLKDIPKYMAAFKKRGLPFGVLPFWGQYQGREYPASYSKQENALMSPCFAGRNALSNDNRNILEHPKGHPCNAGHTYAAISANGDAFRCSGAAAMPGGQPFANIFDDNFELLKTPMPCEADICVTNDGDKLLVLNTTSAGQ